MDDLVIKRMETTKLTEVTFDTREDLLGKRAIRPILPNIPITAEMIDNPPLIKKAILSGYLFNRAISIL